MREASTRRRQPSGLRAGGQFAAEPRPEAPVTLHDREGRLVEPARPGDRDWFVVTGNDGVRRARHRTEVSWLPPHDVPQVEVLADAIESSTEPALPYDTWRICRKLIGAGAIAPDDERGSTNAERLEDLVDDTWDEGWTPRGCARSLVERGVRLASEPAEDER